MKTSDQPPTPDTPGQHGEPGRLRKRSVLVAGHRTSVSLENAFWDALGSIARAKGVGMSRLITEIDLGRQGNLSSAIRVYVLGELAAADRRET